MKTERYELDDLVIPILASRKQLGENSCLVKISITESDLRLVIGPRDWHWHRATGKLVGAGTNTEQPGPDDETPAGGPTA